MNVNIHRVYITCDDDIFSGKFELRVHDREDIGKIINNLKKIEGLQEVNQLL
ncbi:MAG: ACT domain-containing protein [Prevotella sp.]